MAVDMNLMNLMNAISPTRSLGRAAAAGLLLASLPAAALGPNSPFASPRAASAAAAGDLAPAAAQAAVPTGSDGLAGVRSGAEPMALIDGQWWPVGGQPRGARLVSVHRAGATLRHADGRIEQLSLLPTAEPFSKALSR